MPRQPDLQDRNAAVEISISEVSVRLGRRKVLRDVHLDFGRGVTALVGANGAGKTTLFRTLTGSLTPQTGTVERTGIDINSSHDAMTAHRSTMGWLPQDPGLPKSMTVDQWLAYAAWMRKIPKGDAPLAIDAAVEDTELTTVRSQRLGQLSGGQQRRAALAAALIGAPSLLLLDEPTNGLDPGQRQRFLERIAVYAQSRAVLLATHLLEDVGLVADRWHLIDRGTVAGSGIIDNSTAATTASSVAAVRHLMSDHEQ